MKYSSFKDLYNYFNTKLLENNYTLEKSDKNEKKEVYFYTKYTKSNVLEIVVIMKIGELVLKIADELDEECNNFLKEITTNKHIKTLYRVPILVVDSSTYSFIKFSNLELMQDFRNYILPVYYSLEDKMLYIRKQTNNYQILHYKNMKSRFESMMDIKMEEQIKKEN